MSSSDVETRVAGIVSGHANFPEGLISAVDQITGKGSLLFGLSSRDLGAQDLEARMRVELARTGAQALFTDLPGGSATHAARRILRDTPGVVLVTGTNLGVLLDFVFHSYEGVTAAARQAAERGRVSITISEAP